jgi:hypothetical protein
MELCQLAGLPPAAAMCEILDTDGEALRPSSIAGDTLQSQENQWWRTLPYVSTVDLLWYRLLYTQRSTAQWRPFAPESLGLEKKPLKCWRLSPQLEADVLLACTIVQHREQVSNQRLKLRIHNGYREWNNGIADSEADAEICMMMPFDCTLEAPLHISDYCDLSAREGLRGTNMAVRRVLTQLRAFEFMVNEFGWNQSRTDWLESVALPVKEDRDILSAVWEL